MTTCQQSTSTYCLWVPKVEMSFGVLWWRKHMPSMNNSLTCMQASKILVWQIMQWSFFNVSLRVCGSYADLNAGIPSEAFKDFSGGVNMAYPLRGEHTTGHDEELWLSLKRATECMSMICCGTAPKGVRANFKDEKNKWKKTSNSLGKLHFF